MRAIDVDYARAFCVVYFLTVEKKDKNYTILIMLLCNKEDIYSMPDYKLI